MSSGFWGKKFFDFINLTFDVTIWYKMNIMKIDVTDEEIFEISEILKKQNCYISKNT